MLCNKLSQQSNTKFIYELEILIPLTATLLSNERSRCSSLPKVCTEQWTEQMCAVNLGRILQRIVELSNENKDYKRQFNSFIKNLTAWQT